MSIFGGGRKTEDNAVWQDKEIRFDAGHSDLDLRTGEYTIDILEPIEDTKGNGGENGELRVTNLRLLWVSKKNKKTNISIGYSCITGVNTRAATSRIKGPTQSLYILTKFHNQRFEFIFTSISNTNPKLSAKLLSTVQAVYRAYDNSRLYRDLKLRGAVIADRELKLLNQEQTYSKVNGVWNLSSEQGNLGSFFITNVRVVWFANLAENFNVSIPYLQIKVVKVRESKFGQALVIETTPQSGGYILGFKIDPKETLDYVYKEISTLFQVFAQQPVFGVEVNPDEDMIGNPNAHKISEAEEDVEIVDAGDKGDILAAYYADGGKGQDHEPMYCPELGLAIEQLKDGMTLDQLWSVL